jgi:TolB-like protein
MFPCERSKTDSRKVCTRIVNRTAYLGDVRALLGATYVVSGAYRVIGKALITTVELADTRQGEIVWANGFKADLGSLIAQEDSLPTAIASGVRRALINTPVMRSKSPALQNWMRPRCF